VERRVKERLVGAAVLMAAAIILIPEMLSGPKREQRSAGAQMPNEAPLKTYTIDLNRSPGAPTTTQIEERAPPPEETPANSAPAETQSESGAPQLSENPTPAAQAVPERARPAEATPPRQERLASDSPPVARTPAPEPSVNAPTARPIASAPAVPTSRGWAVQLGSFASRVTADGMVKDLSQQGQSAFVMPVRSGASTLYRVRIGPFADRAVANKALLDVKGRVANAAVVAHP
jgi:DedD protein